MAHGGYDRKSMESEEDWKDSAQYGKQKKENFSYKNYRDLSGMEVFCNAHTEVSYMSSYFLSKWQQANINSEILMNGRRSSGTGQDRRKDIPSLPTHDRRLLTTYTRNKFFLTQQLAME
jgi:hypothetical protein